LSKTGSIPAALAKTPYPWLHRRFAMPFID
jgi:hypothetical protein